MSTRDLTSQPPYSQEAEQAILGSVLVANNLIGDVAAIISPDDFYEPRHATVMETILRLDDQGKPVELASLITELRHTGTLAQVGGPQYISHISRQASLGNALYYADVIAEKSGKRKLQNLFISGLKNAEEGSGLDLETLVGEAQNQLDAISDKAVTSDVVRVGETLDETLDTIDKLKDHDGTVTGVPTGFVDLDRVTSGLHPGQMITVAARPGHGKALALDTPLPTPDGWTTMGEVAVGDHLIDRTGRPTRVTAVTDVMTDRPCYEVTFSDGERIVADGSHQWLTETRASRRSNDAGEQVVTTEEIAQTLRVGSDNRLNHSIKLPAAVHGEHKDLLIQPYTLGAWLGDGHSHGCRITSETPEIPMYIEAEGYEVRPHRGLLYSILLPEPTAAAPERHCVVCGTAFTNRSIHVQTCGRVCGGASALPGAGNRPLVGCPDCGQPYSGGRLCQTCRLDHGTFTGLLRKLNVYGNKHIPAEYLRASVEQRRALLAGLLDTDGTVVKSGGGIEISLTNKRLVDDVYELCVSLGYRVNRASKRVQGRTEASSVCYSLRFTTQDQVFRLTRKQIAHKQHRPGRYIATRRYIRNVTPVAPVPVRCVQVDNPEHMYLAGHSMVPTHNSTLGTDFVRSAAIKHGIPSLLFSLEMSKTEIDMKLFSAEARVELQRIRTGNLSESDWEKLAAATPRISEAPLFIDDTASNTMSQIKSKARRIKQRYGLGLIVIDYIQLMRGEGRSENRQTEVSEISRSIKLMAKELGLPVVAMAQLNRGPETRGGDGKPRVSDLRESGAIEQDSDSVFLIHREEVNDPETTRVGEADIFIGKQRSGPQGVTVVLGFQGHLARFVDHASETTSH